MCLTCRYYNRFGLFRQAPLVIYFQIFFRRGTGQQESVTLGGARRWTLAPVVERAPGGLSRRGGVGRRTGVRGRGRQESVTQQCPGLLGSHPCQTLAWVPYRLCLLFNSPSHTPTPLIGSPVRIPHHSKIF